MPTIEQSKWISRVLGISSGEDETEEADGEESLGTSATKRIAAVDLSGLDPDEKRIMELLRDAAIASNGMLPQKVQQAAETLAVEFKKVEPELKELVKQLQSDDMGAIDVAITLSRVGDIRGGLGRHIDALSATLK